MLLDTYRLGIADDGRTIEGSEDKIKEAIYRVIEQGDTEVDDIIFSDRGILYFETWHPNRAGEPFWRLLRVAVRLDKLGMRFFYGGPEMVEFIVKWGYPPDSDTMNVLQSLTPLHYICERLGAERLGARPRPDDNA
ncbi:hypothetical protein H072_3415 [Dactylellina haptotyla CBS 200.50]|uniref:Uncharacterized protein n=1 Tax=Dactylellina haptotyla (strain CBS 200.50) TaxID=1284197 RepID=S8AHZ7_DACHA|nr:hypothetical protein H072_3415 [Dactylellina haptotyla CBS 200.50]